MKLSRLIISNFQCFGTSPTTIDFEQDLSVLIGLNGTGKTATLQALSRLFGINEQSRRIQVTDFHCDQTNKGQRSENLSIEAWFHFPELQDGTLESDLTAIAGTFNQLCFTSKDKTLLLRIRLEATLTFDEVSPEGTVNDTVFYILTDENIINNNQKKELRRNDRNNIQVHYIPASRNPLKEISSSTKVLLGRLLNAINWDKRDGGELSKALNHTKMASQNLTENNAIKLIEQELNISWKKMYSGDFFSQTKINFLPMQIDELLKTVSLSFSSDQAGENASIDRLSDGQRSLLHIAIIQAVHELESKVIQDIKNKDCFNHSKLKKPIFTLLALEEPENHLAPHFLGRITNSMKILSQDKDAQVIVTTHSPNLVKRVEPEQLRYFRLEKKTRKTLALKVPLPKKGDDFYKYVSGAVKAYPEIYFSRVVILGEGESELIVLPKIFDTFNTDIDSSFITIAPLGGRHVNHFWKLLNGLGIPHITLLDLDYARAGAGWGRIKYVFKQLQINNESLKITDTFINSIPAWDNDDLYPLGGNFSEGFCHTSYLEDMNVYFSEPIDLDYSMQLAFPKYYNETLNNESGPKDKDWDELKKAVLKKGYSDNNALFFDVIEHKKNFLWYNYRFLSSKGKPTAHINALENIDFSDPENIEKIPVSIKKIITKAQQLISELPE